MKLVPFAPAMAAGVARCYNHLILPVPDCYPVPPERFASLEGLTSPLLRDEAITVAQDDDGHVRGFVHVGISTQSKDSGDPPAGLGVIRVLAYRPDERPVGKALLDWAEAWMRERERTAVLAWSYTYRYPFYHFHCAHLSERIGHVRALLGLAGYQEMRRELFLAQRDFVPSVPQRPDIDFELKLNWTDGPIGPHLEVNALQGGERVGCCFMDRGQDSPSPEAQDWCFCVWLWVADRLQGKRLGRFLISTALQEMHRAGCRHASISTGWENHRAALLYTSLGYQHTDRTVCFIKLLDEASEFAFLTRLD
jgi:GNAT superfamily N-acetyltransferase